MKKIILFCTLGLLLGFYTPAQAGSEAVFSATSDKTSYKVGEEVKVSLNVDAGPYATTLSVIDFDVKISDPTVIEPASSNPFTVGSIYTNTVTQSYANGKLSVVVFVDPNNKPANRSGVVGTLTFKAAKAGKALISYDSIQATEQGNELEYITTTASSLTITVGDVSAQTTETPTAGAVTTTKTVTPQPGKATTGPTEVILVSIIAGLLLLFGYKYYKKSNAITGKI